MCNCKESIVQYYYYLIAFSVEHLSSVVRSWLMLSTVPNKLRKHPYRDSFVLLQKSTSSEPEALRLCVS